MNLDERKYSPLANIARGLPPIVLWGGANHPSLDTTHWVLALHGCLCHPNLSPRMISSRCG